MSESTQYKLAEIKYNGMTFTAHADIYPDGSVINQWTQCRQRNPSGSHYVDIYHGDERWSIFDNHLFASQPIAELLCKLITEADGQLKHFITELTR